MHDIAIAASSFEQGFKDTFSMLLDSRNDHGENTAIQNKLKECGDVLAAGPPKSGSQGGFVVARCSQWLYLSRTQ